MKIYKGAKYIYNYENCIGAEDDNMETLELHPDTRTIDENAFIHSNIKEIIFNKKLSVIKPSAFENTKIEKLDLSVPIKLRLHGQAFANNKNLKEIIFGDNMSYIPAACFYKCAIKNVDLSNTKITYLAPDVFLGCSYLENVKLPSTLEEIGGSVFAMTNIKYIDLPKKVSKIGEYAFEDTSIDKLTIPSSLILDEDPYAVFYSNSDIKEIFYNTLKKDTLKILEEVTKRDGIKLTQINLEMLLASHTFKESNNFLKNNTYER